MVEVTRLDLRAVVIADQSSSQPVGDSSMPTVSIVIINKDDPALAETLAALSPLADVQSGEGGVDRHRCLRAPS